MSCIMRMLPEFFPQVQTYYAEIPDFQSFQEPHGKFMCV